MRSKTIQAGIPYTLPTGRGVLLIGWVALCGVAHIRARFALRALLPEVARTACAMHDSIAMQAAGAQRIVAAMAAIALLGSGSAQALLQRCGVELMKPCCCAKGDRPAPQPTRVQAADPACCSMTTAPARHDDAAPQATLSQGAPAAVSVAFAVLPAPSPDAAASWSGLQLPRSHGPPILRTTCSLLI
jgi:hypothetical protein